MSAAHTPGPWEAVREDEHEWSIWYNYYVDGEKSPYSSWLADCIHSEANARLIASAPDLLDALLSALPFVKDAADDETYKAHRVHKVLKEIREAIEKATGEKL